ALRRRPGLPLHRAVLRGGVLRAARTARTAGRRPGYGLRDRRACERSPGERPGVAVAAAGGATRPLAPGAAEAGLLRAVRRPLAAPAAGAGRSAAGHSGRPPACPTVPQGARPRGRLAFPLTHRPVPACGAVCARPVVGSATDDRRRERGSRGPAPGGAAAPRFPCTEGRPLGRSAPAAVPGAAALRNGPPRPSPGPGRWAV